MKVAFIQLKSGATIPAYQTGGSAAADIAACLDESLTLQPGERAIVPTGIAIEVPTGYEAQIRARSGLSIKHGICLANGVGTIDSDYRGELGVLLINAGNEPFVVTTGMRIAQMVIARYEHVDFELAEKLTDTKRGDGGYGSTGH
jgi:dUTP pyrophosphatase